MHGYIYMSFNCNAYNAVLIDIVIACILQLYETFVKVCKHYLNGKCCQSDTEFFGTCDLLESHGLIEIKKKKQQNRLSTVSLFKLINLYAYRHCQYSGS